MASLELIVCEKLPWLLIIQKNEGRHTRRVGEGAGGIKSRLRTSCSPGVRGRSWRGAGVRLGCRPSCCPPKCQLWGPGLCPERGHSWPAAAGCHRER